MLYLLDPMSILIIGKASSWSPAKQFESNRILKFGGQNYSWNWNIFSVIFLSGDMRLSWSFIYNYDRLLINIAVKNWITGIKYKLQNLTLL